MTKEGGFWNYAIMRFCTSAEAVESRTENIEN